MCKYYFYSFYILNDDLVSFNIVFYLLITTNNSAIMYHRYEIIHKINFSDNYRILYGALFLLRKTKPSYFIYDGR